MNEAQTHPLSLVFPISPQPNVLYSEGPEFLICGCFQLSCFVLVRCTKCTHPWSKRVPIILRFLSVASDGSRFLIYGIHQQHHSL